MSEIILFPKLKEKLENDIKEAMHHEHFEVASDLFNTYEKHFELDEAFALLRLECLLQTHSYLELREEASILLNQGHSAYSEIILYLIKSLLKLSQYKTVIELVENLRGENVPHQLIMQLNILYDEAVEKLNQKKVINQQFVSEFLTFDFEKQKNVILSIMNDEDFSFQMSFVHLLSLQLHPEVKTLILMYLKLSGYQHKIKLDKIGIYKTIDVTKLAFVQHHPFNEVILEVIQYFENNQPSMIEAIQMTMTMHHFIVYPFHESYFNLSLDDSTNIDKLTIHYIAFFNELFNGNMDIFELENKIFEQNTFHIDKDMLQKIRQLSEVTV